MNKIAIAHNCPEWGYLFIKPRDPEWSICRCETNRKLEIKESMRQAEIAYKGSSKSKGKRK